MLFATTLLTALACLVTRVQCNCSFVQPRPAADSPDTSNDDTYGLGDSLDIKWDWDMDAGDLIIFQDYPGTKQGTNLFKELDMGTTSTSYTWHIDLSLLIARPGNGDTPQFHFEILEKGKPDVVCSSHTFAIFVPDDPRARESIDTSVHYIGATATGTSSGSHKPTAATSSSGKATKKPAQTSEASSKDDGGSSGASSSTKGLIALGTILGVAVLGAAGVAAFWFLRRRQQQRNNLTDASVVGAGGGGGAGSSVYQSVPVVSEANSDSRIDPYGRIKSELPGSEVQAVKYPEPERNGYYAPH